ncbi:MAG: four helix bundle protein [Bacteroidales bacterium]|nr:four helix bundle protein [Bacteroidales bacterium]
MKDNVIAQKSKSFAIDVINAYKYLFEVKREYVMSKQLLRSGTSIGANIAEANYAQSEPDFLSKMSISLKEAGETSYWLDLLYESGYINKETYEKLYTDCTEIIKILTSITKTVKDKKQQSK